LSTIAGISSDPKALITREYLESIIDVQDGSQTLKRLTVKSDWCATTIYLDSIVCKDKNERLYFSLNPNELFLNSFSGNNYASVSSDNIVINSVMYERTVSIEPHVIRLGGKGCSNGGYIELNANNGSIFHASELGNIISIDQNRPMISIKKNNTDLVYLDTDGLYKFANGQKIWLAGGENGADVVSDKIAAEATARIGSDASLQGQLNAIGARVGTLEQLGSYVGSFATYADLPKNKSDFANGITLNDFVTIREDETHGGSPTRFIVEEINEQTGAITWTYDLNYSTDITGALDAANAAQAKAEQAKAEIEAETANRINADNDLQRIADSIVYGTQIEIDRLKSTDNDLRTTIETERDSIKSYINNALYYKQNTLNRTVGSNDNATGTVSDTGGNISVPIQVTLAAPTESTDIMTQKAETVNLRTAIQRAYNNIKKLLSGLNSHMVNEYAHAGEVLTTGRLNSSSDGEGAISIYKLQKDVKYRFRYNSYVARATYTGNSTDIIFTFTGDSISETSTTWGSYYVNGGQGGGVLTVKINPGSSTVGAHHLQYVLYKIE
jgi:hypothetical protein